MRFEQKVCLVTGAASGIGAAVTQRLAAEGGTVYALDQSFDHQPAAHDPRRVLDVRDLDRWRTVVDEILQTEGQIDVLVNNAGLVGAYEPIEDIDVDRWHDVVAVNQTGVFYGMRSVAPAMKARGRGSIVNISSIWGLVGAEGVAAYQASKGAVSLMTKNGAASWGASGIRVNSVHPGLIWTPMTRRQDPTISDGLIAGTPLGRAGEAEEVAAAVAFLASDEAGFITGTQLVVDGGFTVI